MTMGERIAKWARWWAAQPKGPTQGELEQANAVRQRQLGEAFLDEAAKHIAVKGIFVPGEPFDDVPTPPRGVAPDAVATSPPDGPAVGYDLAPRPSGFWRIG
jgi:hypothetical protein